MHRVPQPMTLPPWARGFDCHEQVGLMEKVAPSDRAITGRALRFPQRLLNTLSAHDRG